MSSTHPFDIATGLQPAGKGRYHGATSTAYGNLVGPFGGATAATLMRAVLEHEDRSGDPVALTVNFCGGISDGVFEIFAKLQRTGKYTQHWSLELIQDGSVRATASIVCGVRNDGFSHQTAKPPKVPEPDSCERMPAVGLMGWVERYSFRFAEGAPSFSGMAFGEPNDSRSVLWISDLPERPLDYVSLAAMSDAFFLRLLHVRGSMVPMGTVSLSTFFHATPDEIAAQGTVPLLGVAEAKRFHASFHDQHMELWGRDGQLLATGAQTVWFKD
uniref:Acyl-CoA thioesterase n=1 Tax=uncultured bacterium ws406H10 TaxID=1131831 RepID=I1X5G6_9BACT|nr:hypothetical protein ws406H10_0029 [uncultured bacterium ws406H10]